jgi:hypothetical protein
MALRKWVRETSNELDTALTRNNMVRDTPEMFGTIHDIKGNVVPTETIKRVNEYAGAGIEYLTCLVDYVCTHFKNSILQTDPDYYSTPKIEWALALDIMTGGAYGQRKIAENEILRYLAHPKQALCKCADGHYMSAQPFVVVFDWGTKEDLEAKAVARLAKLKNNTKNAEVLPLSNIRVMFFKPLFDGFLKKRFSTYSFPTGMYAKIYQQANGGLRIEGIESDASVTAHSRLARYIIRHNNLPRRAKQDAYGKLGHVTLNIRDMLKETNPALINKNGHGKAIIDWKNLEIFTTEAECILWQIPGFIAYPVFTDSDKTSETIGIDLYKTGQAASQAATGHGRPGMETEE